LVDFSKKNVSKQNLFILSANLITIMIHNIFCRVGGAMAATLDD